MGSKMVETRFTIQFSQTDPTHLQVAEILNRQGRRSKAQYIVNAVLHYENCGETPNMQRTSELDIKIIEAVVNRILREKFVTPIQSGEDINTDDVMDSLGKDEINAITGALDMFRKK